MPKIIEIGEHDDKKEGTMTFYQLNLNAYEPLKQLFLDIDAIVCSEGE